MSTASEKFTWTPIHQDHRLNNSWWSAKGYHVGVDVYYNAIRDRSGRYDGYVMMLSRKMYTMRTIEEAETILRMIP